MKLIVSALCKQGGREYNQDAFAVELGDGNACLAVCDGLGSYYGSEIASATAANYITSEFNTLAKARGNQIAIDKLTIQKIIEKAHESILDIKDENPNIASSCTTVAVFATIFDKTVCAHIGDTRIYMFRQGRLSFQTTDHSMAQYAVDQGKITLAQIRNHPDQNKLTRVLGSEYFTPADINYLDSPLEIGDAIILCTDGFWEYVFESEMEDDLAKSFTPESALEKMESRLLKRVGKYNDNYTAIIAYVVE